MATTIRQHMITCGGACSVVAEINQLLVAFLKNTPVLHYDDFLGPRGPLVEPSMSSVHPSCVALGDTALFKKNEYFV